jgi:F-type H+-transporting ATPase subunit b
MSAAELWIVVATIIFIALIFRPSKRAAGAALSSRRNRIVHDLEEAARLRREAETLLAEAKAQHARAASDAAGIIAFAQAEASRLRQRAESDMRQSIARRERQANDRIAQAEANAIAEIRTHAIDLALGASVELFADKLSGDAGDRLLDEVIASLPAKMANAR